MKYRLTIEVDISPEGFKNFRESYPDLSHESHFETLFREAVVAWDWEHLIAEGEEPELVEAVVVQEVAR